MKEIDEISLRKRYLKNLRKFHKQGVRVLIDGREETENNWNRLFRVSDDGGFYMADFVEETEGGVREIRFDRVRLRDFGI